MFKKILKYFGYFILVLVLVLNIFLVYKIIVKNNKIQNYNSNFIKTDKDTFNDILYNKAFSIDKDLIKIISKKIYLINCNSCLKYLNIEKYKINFLSYLKEVNKYNQDKKEEINKCKKWFNVSTSLNNNDTNKKLDDLSNLEGIKYCNNFIKGYNKNGNVIKDYLTIPDIKIYNNLLTWDDKTEKIKKTGKGISDMNNIEYTFDIIYKEYCGDKPFSIRNISSKKEKLVKNLICKKKYIYPRNNINLEDIRRFILFVFLYKNDIKARLSIKKIKDTSYIDKIYSIYKGEEKIKNKNKNKKIETEINKYIKYFKNKDIYIQCYKISVKPNIITDTNIVGDTNNINILRRYASNNYNEIMCITTKYDKSNLVFTKKFSTFLNQENKLNPESKILLYNNILGNIVQLENDLNK